MKRSRIAIFLLIVFVGAGLFSAYKLFFTSKENVPESSTPIVETPVFNADTSYAFVKKQVEFGPRVPGTAAHKSCRDWFVQQLKSYGWQVQIQEFKETSYE